MHLDSGTKVTFFCFSSAVNVKWHGGIQLHSLTDVFEIFFRLLNNGLTFLFPINFSSCCVFVVFLRLVVALTVAMAACKPRHCLVPHSDGRL